MVDTFAWKDKLILNITPFRPYSENSCRFGDVTSAGISAVVSLKFNSHSPSILSGPLSSAAVPPIVSNSYNSSDEGTDKNDCLHHSTTLVFEIIQIHGSSIFCVGSTQLKLCDSYKDKISSITKAACVCCWHCSGQYVLVNLLNRMFLFSLKLNQRSIESGGIKGTVTLQQALAASISATCKYGGEDDSSIKVDDDKLEEWHPLRLDITFEREPVPSTVPIYKIVNLSNNYSSNLSSAFLGIVTDDIIIRTDWMALKEVAFFDSICDSFSKETGTVSSLKVELWRVTREGQRFDFNSAQLSAKGSSNRDDQGAIATVSAVECIAYVSIESSELLLATLSDGSLSILKSTKNSDDASSLTFSTAIGVQVHPVFTVAYAHMVVNDERVIIPIIRTGFEASDTKVSSNQKDAQEFVYEEISRVLSVKVLQSNSPSDPTVLLLISTCHMPSEAIDAAVHSGSDKAQPVMDHTSDASGLLQVPRQESLSLMEVLLTRGDSNDHVNLRCLQWNVFKTRIWRSNREQTKFDDVVESIHTMIDPFLSAVLVLIDGVVTGISRENFSEILFTIDTSCLAKTVRKSPVCEVVLTRRLAMSAVRGCMLLAVSELKELSPDLSVCVASFLHVVPVLLPLKSCDSNPMMDGRQQQLFWIDLVNLTIAVQETTTKSMLDTVRRIPLLLHSARSDIGHWRTVKLPKQLLLQLMTRDCIVDQKGRFLCTKNDSDLPFMVSSTSQCTGFEKGYGIHGKTEFIAWMDRRCWVRNVKGQKELPLYYMVLWVHNSTTGRWKGIDLSLVSAKNFMKHHDHANAILEMHMPTKKLFEPDDGSEIGGDGSTHDSNSNGEVNLAVVSVKSSDDLPVAAEINDITSSADRGKRPREGSVTGAPSSSPRAGQTFPSKEFSEELKLSSFHCFFVRWLNSTAVLLITSRGPLKYIEVLSKDCLPSANSYGPYQRGSLRKSSKHVLFEILLGNEPQLLDIMVVGDVESEPTRSIDGTSVRKYACLISDGVDVIVVEISIHLSGDESQGRFSIANHIFKFTVCQLWKSSTLDNPWDPLAAEFHVESNQPKIIDAKLWTVSRPKPITERGGLHFTLLTDSGSVRVYHIKEGSQVHTVAIGPTERNAKITSIMSVDVSFLRSHSRGGVSDDQDELSPVLLMDELIFCLTNKKVAFVIVQYKDSEGIRKSLLLPFDHKVHTGSSSRSVFEPSRQKQDNGADIRAIIIFDLFQSLVNSLNADEVSNGRDDEKLLVVMKLLKFLISPTMALTIGKRDRKGSFIDFHGLAQLIEYRLLEMASGLLTQVGDTQQQSHFRAVCGVLWTFNQTLFCEVMSKLCRKLEPSSSGRLFPVSVPEAEVGLSILRLFELSLEGGRLLQSARFLSSACESVGGSSSHISAVASFILALEFFLQCSLKMSLKLGKDTLEFCLRIEAAIKLHCKMIFGTYTTRKDHSNRSNERPLNSKPSDNTAREDRRQFTLDGSYIKTVKSKAFRLIDNARVETVDDRPVENSLLHWMSLSARGKGDNNIETPTVVRTKRVYEDTYYPGKGIISAVSDIIEWAAPKPRPDAQENGQGIWIDSVFQPAAARKTARNEAKGKDVFFYKAISVARSACGEQQFTNALSGGGAVDTSDVISLTMCTVAAAVRSMLNTGSHYYTATVLITSLLKSEPFVATMRQYLRCRLAYLEFNNMASESVEEKVNHALLVFRLTRATVHGDEEEMVRRLGKPLDAQFLRRVVEAEMVYALIKSDPTSSSSHSPRFFDTAGISHKNSCHDSGENLADNGSGPSASSSRGPREPLNLGSSYFELTEDFFEGSAVGNGSVLQLVRSLCLCFLIAGELQCLRQLVRKLGPLTPLLFGPRRRKQKRGKSSTSPSMESSLDAAYSEDISAFTAGLSNNATALESSLLETIMRLLLPAEKQS